MSSNSQNPFPDGPVRQNYHGIFNPQVTLELYNPGDKPFSFSFDGVDYHIPACDKHWEGRGPDRKPMRWPRPGVLPLWDRMDGRTPAVRIARFVVGKDGYSSQVGAINGIRLLFGDERDDSVTEEAQETHHQRMLYLTEERVRQWESYVSQQRASGQPVKPMPRKVRDAYYYRSQNYGALQAKHACKICSWPFPEELQVFAHVIATHKDRPTEVAAAEAELAKLGRKIEEIEVVDELANTGDGARVMIPGNQGDPDERLVDADQPLPPLEQFDRSGGAPKADPVKLEENIAKQTQAIRQDVNAAASGRAGKTVPQVMHRAGK